MVTDIVIYAKARGSKTRRHVQTAKVLANASHATDRDGVIGVHPRNMEMTFITVTVL